MRTSKPPTWEEGLRLTTLAINKIAITSAYTGNLKAEERRPKAQGGEDLSAAGHTQQGRTRGTRGASSASSIMGAYQQLDRVT